MSQKKKEPPENGCCRFCKYVTETEGIYRCRGKKEVRPGEICRRYKFEPFAVRDKRKRTFDTSVLDPLDFEI